MVLPREIYHQCLWIVRDMVRMEQMVAATRGGAAGEEGAPALEEARIRLECIRRALLDVPEFYREGILESILVRGCGYADGAHENTWKKWRQRFLYSLAEHLSLY